MSDASLGSGHDVIAHSREEKGSGLDMALCCSAEMVRRVVREEKWKKEKSVPRETEVRRSETVKEFATPL